MSSSQPTSSQPISRRSRVYRALCRYASSSAKPTGGRGRRSHPTTVFRVPVNFLEDLDDLIDEYSSLCASTSSPRYDKLRQFLSELKGIL